MSQFFFLRDYKVEELTSITSILLTHPQSALCLHPTVQACGPKQTRNEEVSFRVRQSVTLAVFGLKSSA
jgi:hypothetical protein